MRAQHLTFLFAAAAASFVLGSAWQGLRAGAPPQQDATGSARKPPKTLRVAPERTPFWDTVSLDDDMPFMLVRVPSGQRFVLTDVWFLSREEESVPVNDEDRVWLECKHGNKRYIVFDSPVSELRLPLRWETGVAFEEGQEAWINYDFANDTDRMRRVHYTGYFEPTEAGAVEEPSSGR